MSSPIAQTIAQQLGGMSRLGAMVSAHNFVDRGNGLGFKFKGCRTANHMTVELRKDDTYTVTFSRVRGVKVAMQKPLVGVYAGDLVELFERTTNLYLSL